MGGGQERGMRRAGEEEEIRRGAHLFCLITEYVTKEAAWKLLLIAGANKTEQKHDTVCVQHCDLGWFITGSITSHIQTGCRWDSAPF